VQNIFYEQKLWAKTKHTVHATNSSCKSYTFKGKGKGKAIPLHVWTGPKGSRRLRLPDFKTTGT